MTFSSISMAGGVGMCPCWHLSAVATGTGGPVLSSATLRHRQQAATGLTELDGEVAGHVVAEAVLAHLGLDLGAHVLRLRAAGAEPAAAGRGHRRRDLARQGALDVGPDAR